MLTVSAVPALRTGALVAALAILTDREHALKIDAAVGKRSATLIPEWNEDSSTAHVAGRRDPVAAHAVVRTTALGVHLSCALRHVLECARAGVPGVALKLSAAVAASSSCQRKWRAGWLDDAGAAVLAGLLSLADYEWRRPTRLLACVQVDAASVCRALAGEQATAAAVGGGGALVAEAAPRRRVPQLSRLRPS